MTSPTVEVFADHETASEAVAALLAARLHKGGRVALAGGETPRRTYELLAQEPLPWNAIDIVATDERCVPADNPARNDLMIARALGDKGYTLHRYPADLGPQAAAQRMAPEVMRLLPFDVVLLGLGEDGHTASLFAGSPLLHSAVLVAPVYNAAKPPSARVTLTPAALGQAGVVVFLATGLRKRDAVAALVDGGPIPAAHISAPDLRLFTTIDAAPQRLVPGG